MLLNAENVKQSKSSVKEKVVPSSRALPLHAVCRTGGWGGELAGAMASEPSGRAPLQAAGAVPLGGAVHETTREEVKQEK